MEQQRIKDIHLTSVDDGSSYQTFQDSTTLLGRNVDGHSSVASGPESISRSRIQLISNGDSGSKVKDEEGTVNGTGVATVSFVLKTISICLTYFSTVSCLIIYHYCSNKLSLQHQELFITGFLFFFSM